MNKLKTICLILFLAIFNTEAAIILIPTDTKDIGSGDLSYQVIISSWDVNDNTPNPCYNSASPCNVQPNHAHTPSNQGEKSYYLIDQIKINQYQTIGQIGAAFIKEFPLPHPFSIGHYGPQLGGSECLGFFYYEGDHHTANHKLLPGSQCVPPMPAEPNCIINGNSNIKHGTLLANEVNGNKKETTLNISCTQDVAMSVYFQGSVNDNIQLRSDGSLESEITLNGHKGVDGVKLEVKANIISPLNIASTLIQHGDISEGPFKGSGSVTFTYD